MNGADEAIADADALEVEVGDEVGVVLAILEVNVSQGGDVGAAVRLAERIKLDPEVKRLFYKR